MRMLMAICAVVAALALVECSFRLSSISGGIVKLAMETEELRHQVAQLGADIRLLGGHRK